jgi:hypothetical protein
VDGVPKSVLGEERSPLRDSEAGIFGVDHDMVVAAGTDALPDVSILICELYADNSDNADNQVDHVHALIADS